MAPGDICLAQFPFGDAPCMKLRPMLLLTGRMGTVPEMLVAYISSAVPPTRLASDILLDPSRAEHVGTHLETVSVLRLHKLATIHARSVLRQLGRLPPTTVREVKDKLRVLLSL